MYDSIKIEIETREAWANIEAETWPTIREELIFTELHLLCVPVVKVTVKPCFTVQPTALNTTASLSLSADIGTHDCKTTDNRWKQLGSVSASAKGYLPDTEGACKRNCNRSATNIILISVFAAVPN